MEVFNVTEDTQWVNGSGNSTSHLQDSFDINVGDTNWILTSSFIIFTMQTGFGMLESGCVSIKNEANIMMKNVVDIVLGGLTYWMFGYGMSFGQGPLTNPFIGLGDFFVDPGVGDPLMGPVFAAFLFQLSFATTATTIVSGAMAERCNFKAYCIFSLLNTAVYCIPAGWVWGEHGFLYRLGAVDIAGSGPVHLVGGAASFASALMLGPRLGRYARGTDPLPLGNPVNAVMGLFVLWWGWLAFNSGSTYGVSGAKWQYAARAAVMTMMGSFGGGCVGLAISLLKNKGHANVMDMINSILGALVSVTAGCFLYRAWEALLIGAIGAVVASVTGPLFDRFHVDDPVGASAVHGCCGIWGVIAVGLFADNPIPLDTTRGMSGLFKGGGWYMLGVQSLTALCLLAWGVGSTLLMLYLLNKVVPIRMKPHYELLGADLTEHDIRHGQVGVSRAISALRPQGLPPGSEDITMIGINPGHARTIDQIYSVTTLPVNGRQDKTPKYLEDGSFRQVDADAILTQCQACTFVWGNHALIAVSLTRINLQQQALAAQTSALLNAFAKRADGVVSAVNGSSSGNELINRESYVSKVRLSGGVSATTEREVLEQLAADQQRSRPRLYFEGAPRSQLAWLD